MSVDKPSNRVYPVRLTLTLFIKKKSLMASTLIITLRHEVQDCVTKKLSLARELQCTDSHPLFIEVISKQDMKIHFFLTILNWKSNYCTSKRHDLRIIVKVTKTMIVMAFSIMIMIIIETRMKIILIVTQQR